MVQSAILSSVSSSSSNYQSSAKDWHTSQPSVSSFSKKVETTKKEDTQKKNVNSQYGAWGPTFKNKDYFASLHHC